MENQEKKVSWVGLESNPEVMSKFLHRLGVPEKWGLVDVYGLDLHLLLTLPEPVVAFILLYPISENTEILKLELEEKEREKGDCSDKVYHMVQYVSNACGTIALVHSVANNLDKIELKDGELKKFLDETKDLSSVEKGKRFAVCEGISKIHHDFAQEGQTEAPREDEKLIHHFVAFVEKNGSLYELDGRKPFAINHGPSNKDTFLEDAARVCQEYMNRDPENVGFTMMALAAVE